MNIIYITKGEKLRVKQGDLCILKEDVETTLTPEEINSIIIESTQCSITSGALILCSEYDIPLIICNNKAQPQVYCHDLYDFHKITSQLQGQIKWLDSQTTFKVYREIIKLKLQHQLDLLTLLECSNKDREYISDYICVINQKNEFSEIDSIEAICAKMFFKSLFGSDFKRREDNYINAGLNYGYAIIRSLIMSIIVTKGLHPSLGLWHHSQFNNFNLADDIIELYRPMVDYIVFNSIKNTKEFDKDFRIKLQHLLIQNIEFDSNIVTLKQSIIYLVDNLINALNNDDINLLVLPKLKVELYEY